jgi:hypothetical protein
MMGIGQRRCCCASSLPLVIPDVEADWSVAAGDADPVLVVPWRDEAGGLVFIDLRDDPALVDRIPEARDWPEMRSALLRLNGNDSPVWTAKFGPVASGLGAYVDTIPRDLNSFSSLPVQIAVAQRLVALAMEVSLDDARVEYVLRPAQWHEREGYALTIYVYGYGSDEDEARSQWSTALGCIVDHIAEAQNETVE